MSLKNKLSYIALGVFAAGGIVLVDCTSQQPVFSFNKHSSAVPQPPENKVHVDLPDPIKQMQERGRAERQLRCGDKRNGTVSYARQIGREPATATMNCATGSVKFSY